MKKFEAFKIGKKVKVAECYLTDEVTENYNTSKVATICSEPSDKEELVSIQYESGEIDFVPQWILEIIPLFKLHSNQYIPRKGKILPSGLPACSTYYYLTNVDGKVVDKATLKPYRGKEMSRYAIHSKVEAEAYLEVINKIW